MWHKFDLLISPQEASLHKGRCKVAKFIHFPGTGAINFPKIIQIENKKEKIRDRCTTYKVNIHKLMWQWTNKPNYTPVRTHSHTQAQTRSHIYIYIYIYRERERESEKERKREREINWFLCIFAGICFYSLTSVSEFAFVSVSALRFWVLFYMRPNDLRPLEKI